MPLHALAPAAPQVEKAVKTRRAKLVLLAPNVASIEHPPPPTAAAADVSAAGGGAEGGGEAAAAAAECPAAELAALARERQVPLVFALSRQRMGKVCGVWWLLALHAAPAGLPAICACHMCQGGCPSPLCCTHHFPLHVWCHCSCWVRARRPQPLLCWTPTACLMSCAPYWRQQKRGGVRGRQRRAAAAADGGHHLCSDLLSITPVQQFL